MTVAARCERAVTIEHDATGVTYLTACTDCVSAVVRRTELLALVRVVHAVCQHCREGRPRLRGTHFIRTAGRWEAPPCPVPQSIHDEIRGLTTG